MALIFAPRLWANSDSISDLLQRFDNYGYSIRQLTDSQQNLTILGISEKEFGVKDFSNYKNVKIHLYRKNLLGKIQILRSLISLISKEKVVIAGDPFFTFWFLYFVKRILFKEMQIQVSIHGMPSNKLGRDLLNVRLLGLRLCSRKADSVRVVSQHLSDLLQNSWGISQVKILVAPIPVEIPREVSTGPRKKEILIVGRLHNERGVLLSLEIAVKVLAQDSEVAIHIIGDGPLKSQIEETVFACEFKDRIFMVGKIPHSCVLNKMTHSRVLLSGAPEEGFGLAIREAAYSGLSVVAFRNSGTLEAAEELAPILKVFSSPDDGYHACLQALEGQVDQNTIERIRKNGRLFNEDSLRRLALSWI